MPVDAPSRKQPPGLPLLFMTEMWERFSYYGMRALLILYLIDTTTGGFGWTQERASRFYGWYTALVYLTPIFGGWLADRYLGTAKSLVIGGIVISLGHFTMAADTHFTFFTGLVLIIIGTGFFKANVSTLVGQLYGENDPRRDSGFTIYYIGINTGAFFGPLVCGWLAANPAYGWRYGFGAAGMGMAIGLICYVLLRKKYLGDIGMVPMSQLHADGHKDAAHEPLTREEKDRVLAICIVVVFVAFFWLAFEQAGSSLNVFAQQKTQRAVGGWLGSLVPNGEIPAAWFQSVGPFFILTLSPLFAMMWTRMGTRQPSTPAKMTVGLFLLGLGFVVICAGASLAGATGLASPMFLIGLYFLHTCGEAASLAGRPLVHDEGGTDQDCLHHDGRLVPVELLGEPRGWLCRGNGAEGGAWGGVHPAGRAGRLLPHLRRDVICRIGAAVCADAVAQETDSREGVRRGREDVRA